jgi:hypothetical protein
MPLERGRNTAITIPGSSTPESLKFFDWRYEASRTVVGVVPDLQHNGARTRSAFGWRPARLPAA